MENDILKSKKQLIEEFKELTIYINAIKYTNLKKFELPIAEGKWTVKDIVSHIMLWDKYFLEEAIANIAASLPLTLKHLNFDEFNQGAIEYAKDEETEKLLTQAIEYRSKIVSLLEQIPEEDFHKPFVDGDGHDFVIAQYIPDFVGHDRIHLKQISDFLE